MGASKLKAIHVVIIGVFVCVVLVVGMYMTVIKKTTEDIGVLNKKYADANAIWITKASVEAQLQAAIAHNNMVMAKYNMYVKQLMPPITFEDRPTGMIAMWKEQLENLGPMMQKWIAHLNTKDASCVCSFGLGAPPVDPNSPTYAAPILSIPLGGVEAVGSFESILSQVRAWNKCPRLAQVDPVGLSGAGKFLTGKYNVTLYIFPQGTVGPTVPMAGGAAAAPAAVGPPPAPAGGASAGHVGSTIGANVKSQKSSDGGE